VEYRDVDCDWVGSADSPLFSSIAATTSQSTTATVLQHLQYSPPGLVLQVRYGYRLTPHACWLLDGALS
jgi:hypothetical protein